MATLDVGSGRSRRRPVDSNIPLIPFIDLLLCCVMFLLVTAVWNELAGHDVAQQIPGRPSADEVPTPKLELVLQLRQQGYVLASTAGDRLEIPKVGDAFDLEGLRAGLVAYRAGDPNHGKLSLTAEDGLVFDDIIEAMDLAVGTGFTKLSLSES